MAVVTLVVSIAFQNILLDSAQENLKRACVLTASAIEGNDLDLDAGTLGPTFVSDDELRFLDSLRLDPVRVTIIDWTGDVLYDSKTAANLMPNHKDRPEVKQALETGEGSSIRTSGTMGYVSVYHAVMMKDGRVLRLGEDEAGITAILRNASGTLVLVLALIVLISAIASRVFADWLIKPIMQLDVHEAESEAPYSELQPLVRRLAEQDGEIRDQVRKLKLAAEIRQQYTSNVTHELKTPIASISGAAELVESGLVPPEDVPGFVHRIRGDADRLSNLVSDILTLSKLDESERSGDASVLGTASPCDLLSICADVAARLEGPAEMSDVTIKVDGSEAIVRGLPRLLDEMVSNLVSNAIRYNKPGGTVTMTCGITGDDAEAGSPYVCVEDTGIGIPEGEQEKVFARFYRVDTSRSRATGGTGLGLAIVKHAAMVHGAEVKLESEVDQGTKITVTFPLARQPK